jgi:hypothetical protein
MDIVQVDTLTIARASNLDRDLHIPGGELRGHVQSELEPLQYAVVVVERLSVSGEAEFAAKVFSSADGTWRAPHLTDGRYLVRVYPAGGLAWSLRDDLELRDGALLADVNFQLNAGSELRLVLRGPSGAPLSGVSVQLFDERGRECTPAQSLRTNAAGACVLRGLPSGRSRLVLRQADGTSSEHWLSTQAPLPLDLELNLSEK